MTVNFFDVIKFQGIPSNRMAKINAVLNEFASTSEGQVILSRIQSNYDYIYLTSIDGPKSGFTPADKTINIDFYQLENYRFVDSNGNHSYSSLNRTLFHELFHAADTLNNPYNEGVKEGQATIFEEEYMSKYYTQPGRFNHEYGGLDVPSPAIADVQIDVFHPNPNYQYEPLFGKDMTDIIFNSDMPWHNDKIYNQMYPGDNKTHGNNTSGSFRIAYEDTLYNNSDFAKSFTSLGFSPSFVSDFQANGWLAGGSANSYLSDYK